MIRPDIRALSAYHVAESGNMIKLDAMENPYPLPDELRHQWGAHLAGLAINRYPDAGCLPLRSRIAERERLKPEQVLLGNGSDELIQMLLIAADNGPCVVPEPTFVMYGIAAKWLKRPVASVPLGRDFALDARKVLETCSREKAAIVFLSCPNNPSGNLWPEETIREIAANFRGIVVIDEAYRPFAERTHTHLIAPNVVVLRTFSKLGWAGLRLGYLLGDAATIEHLNKVRMPYNINALTQASALFFLDRFELFEAQAAEIRAQRALLAAALAELPGAEPFPSQANFILVRLPQASEVWNGLKSRGILVKNLDGGLEQLRSCLRLTIGTPDENAALIAALKEILA